MGHLVFEVLISRLFPPLFLTGVPTLIKWFNIGTVPTRRHNSQTLVGQSNTKICIQTREIKMQVCQVLIFHHNLGCNLSYWL